MSSKETLNKKVKEWVLGFSAGVFTRHRGTPETHMSFVPYEREEGEIQAPRRRRFQWTLEGEKARAAKLAPPSGSSAPRPKKLVPTPHVCEICLAAKAGEDQLAKYRGRSVEEMCALYEQCPKLDNPAYEYMSRLSLR